MSRWSATLELRCDALVRDKGQAEAVNCSANHGFDIIHTERSVSG